MAGIRAFISREKILLLSFLLVIAVFAITRLPFFLYFPLADIDVDTFNYYTLVDQMNKGIWPAFIIRTPGYPLFLKLVFTFHDSHIAVVLVQNLITLFTALFFVYIVHLVFKDRSRYFALLAAMGIGVFISSTCHLESDTSLLTESLYVNLLLLFFAFFLLALNRDKHRWWIVTSIIAASVVLFRPSGMFLLPVVLFILIFLFFNPFKKAFLLSLALPVVLILALASLYNYFTIRSFSVSNFTEHAFFSYASLFTEKSPDFDPVVNEGIDTYRKRIKPRHSDVIFNSFTMAEVRNVMAKYYNRNRVTFFNFLRSRENPEEFNLYMKWRPLLKKIAMHEIKRRPDLYLKFTTCNLGFYFFLIREKNDFYGTIKSRYAQAITAGRDYPDIFFNKQGQTRLDQNGLRIYYKKEYAESIDRRFLAFFLKEYLDPLSPRFPSISISLPPETRQEDVADTSIKGSRKLIIPPLFLQRLHVGFEKVHIFLFQRKAWVLFFFFAVIFSLVQLIRSRFHDRVAFFMFVLTGAAVLQAIGVCMTTFPIHRYSYTMEFAYYLSFFLFPLFLVRKKEKNVSKPLEEKGFRAGTEARPDNLS